MRRFLALGLAALALACALAGAARAQVPDDEALLAAAPAAPAQFAPGPVELPPGDAALAFRLFGRKGRSREPKAPAEPAVLGAGRARILLRSLTVPGWGQATLGRHTSAAFFGLTEAAIWGTFTAFRIQVATREDSYLRTARLGAGIDLRSRDEEYRRIVGNYVSSEEYNRLVVARDAANLYYDDPVKYRAYIAEHSLSGAEAWSWDSPEAMARYQGQRKDAHRAAQRANTALAVAVANRIVSALHAARAASRPVEPARSWNLEVVPVAGQDPTAFQLRVLAKF